MRAVVLAGGTGGAKLAAGMQDVLGEELAVIANTADDTEAFGLHVSPDPDLITYWLTGEIDAERGWGIRGDSFTVFERLVELGAPDWFGLSDRDLATCLRRTVMLAAGERQSAGQAQLAAALGARGRVVPMSDDPVRTRVRTAAGWLGLQEYLVREGGEGEVLELRLEGIDSAAPSPEALAEIEAAEAIVIGPSNPVISIGPILRLPGIAEAIAAAPAPVIAVSPYVGGEILKGPTDLFMRALGHETNTAGVLAAYREVAIDGLVVDSDDPLTPPADLKVVRIPTLMDSTGRRHEVAQRVVELARTLGGDRA